jgi:hypothetical protein
MAHIKQPRPDAGIGFQVKVLKTFQVVHASLGIGSSAAPIHHHPSFLSGVNRTSSVADSRSGTTTLQKCAAVPRRGRV